MPRIESLGSFWEIDEDEHRYRRWPKQEGPRERPEWGDERARNLQDFVWHPYEDWWFSEYGDWLIIRVRTIVDEDGEHMQVVRAPL